MTQDNLTKLQTIVGDQLGIDPSSVKPGLDFTRELGADSLDQVELVMAFEEEFDLDIEDSVAGDLLTLQDALDYIEGRWPKEK